MLGDFHRYCRGCNFNNALKDTAENRECFVILLATSILDRTASVLAELCENH